MSKDLADEIQKTYGKNLDAIAQGKLDQNNYVRMIEASCTLLHASAMLRVAEAIAECGITGQAAVKISSDPSDNLTARDVKLQNDCDHVDVIERGLSSLMMALKNIGFSWKIGEANAISEYGLTYEMWSNGNRKEGEMSPRSTSITKAVGDAIAMFSDAYAKGSRFIVWRIAPEITSHQARKNLSAEWYYKLYFRYHFLPEAPVGWIRDMIDKKG